MKSTPTVILVLLTTTSMAAVENIHVVRAKSQGHNSPVSGILFKNGNGGKGTLVPLGNYLEHKVPKSDDCAVVRLKTDEPERSNDPFKDRKSINATVVWFNANGEETGSFPVNRRTSISAVSKHCEHTYLIDEAFDPAELGSGKYVDPAWEKTGISDTGTLKRHPDLRDSFIVVISSGGKEVAAFRSEGFPKLVVSPDGRWFAYTTDTSYETTYHIRNLITASSGTFHGNLFQSATIDDEGRLSGPSPAFFKPVWEPTR